MTFEPGDRVKTRRLDFSLDPEARGREGTVVERHAFFSTLTGKDVYAVDVETRHGVTRQGVFGDLLARA